MPLHLLRHLAGHFLRRRALVVSDDLGPPPPRNVRLVVDEGTAGEHVVPLELVFEGCDSQGINHWAATAPAWVRGEVIVLRADAIPGRTAMHVAVAGGGRLPQIGLDDRSDD